jgi:archaemetzincin
VTIVELYSSLWILSARIGGRQVNPAMNSPTTIATDASVRTAPPINGTPPPLNLFDKNRKQWESGNILQWLLDRNKPDRSKKILAVCDFDAYSNNLNFVLGQAHVDGRVSAIYLPRLRQEFYGLTDISLFYQRIVKEAVHELGHAFGLNHCNNTRCVMHFSNSLDDTDMKENIFCNICWIRVRRQMIESLC